MEDAANPRERAELELAWKKYKFDLQTWQNAQASRERSNKAKAQQKGKEQEKEDSYKPIQERLKRQQEMEQEEQQKNRTIQEQPQVEQKPLSQEKEWLNEGDMYPEEKKQSLNGGGLEGFGAPKRKRGYI